MTITTDINAIPTPEGTGDGKDVVQNFNDIVDVIDTRLAPRYANGATREAANPSPIDGQIAYQLDTSELYLRRNSDWYRQMMPRSVFKFSNQSITSSAVFINDNALFFSADPFGKYLIELYLMVTGADDSASGAGCKFQFVLPATTNSPRGFVYGLSHPVTGTRDSTPLTYMSLPLSDQGARVMGTATGGTVYAFSTIVEFGASAGTVQLQFAQATSNATPVVILGGSNLTYTKIS